MGYQDAYTKALASMGVEMEAVDTPAGVRYMSPNQDNGNGVGTQRVQHTSNYYDNYTVGDGNGNGTGTGTTPQGPADSGFEGGFDGDSTGGDRGATVGSDTPVWGSGYSGLGAFGFGDSATAVDEFGNPTGAPFGWNAAEMADAKMKGLSGLGAIFGGVPGSAVASLAGYFGISQPAAQELNDQLANVGLTAEEFAMDPKSASVANSGLTGSALAETLSSQFDTSLAAHPNTLSDIERNFDVTRSEEQALEQAAVGLAMERSGNYSVTPSRAEIDAAKAELSGTQTTDVTDASVDTVSSEDTKADPYSGPPTGKGFAAENAAKSDITASPLGPDVVGMSRAGFDQHAIDNMVAEDAARAAADVANASSVSAPESNAVNNVGPESGAGAAAAQARDVATAAAMPSMWGGIESAQAAGIEAANQAAAAYNFESARAAAAQNFSSAAEAAAAGEAAGISAAGIPSGGWTGTAYDVEYASKQPAGTYAKQTGTQSGPKSQEDMDREASMNGGDQGAPDPGAPDPGAPGPGGNISAEWSGGGMDYAHGGEVKGYATGGNVPNQRVIKKSTSWKPPSSYSGSGSTSTDSDINAMINEQNSAYMNSQNNAAFQKAYDDAYKAAMANNQRVTQYSPQQGSAQQSPTQHKPLAQSTTVSSRPPPPTPEQTAATRATREVAMGDQGGVDYNTAYQRHLDKLKYQSGDYHSSGMMAAGGEVKGYAEGGDVTGGGLTGLEGLGVPAPEQGSGQPPAQSVTQGAGPVADDVPAQPAPGSMVMNAKIVAMKGENFFQSEVEKFNKENPEQVSGTGPGEEKTHIKVSKGEIILSPEFAAWYGKRHLNKLNAQGVEADPATAQKAQEAEQQQAQQTASVGPQPNQASNGKPGTAGDVAMPQGTGAGRDMAAIPKGPMSGLPGMA